MEYMKVSEELIEKAFDELNRKCFGSELRKPNFFKVSHSIKRAGSTSCNPSLMLLVRRMGDGSRKP